jgi:hypothetical protein
MEWDLPLLDRQLPITTYQHCTPGHYLGLFKDSVNLAKFTRLQKHSKELALHDGKS